jgi:O-antigen/teichoic acid export membrane protein
MRAFNAFQLIGNFAVLGCLLAAAAAGSGPGGFLAASALGWTAIAASLLFVLAPDTASLRFEGGVFRAGLRYALKAYVITVCPFLVARGNVFLLSAAHGPEQVGYYSVASQMADMMAILPQSIGLVLFPSLVAAGADRFEKTVRSTLVAAGLLASGCAAALVLAGPVLTAAFGSAFAPSVQILHWMLPSIFFLGLSSVTSQYLAAEGIPRSLVAVWVAGAVVSFALGKALIPSLQGYGAAFALSASHAAIFTAIAALTVLHARKTAVIEGAAAAAQGVAS